jgi:hypothetical protein
VRDAAFYPLMLNTQSTAAPELMTVKQAAALANASPSWVRKAIGLGLLPFVDESLEPEAKRRELRVEREALVAFLAARRRPASPAPKAAERLGVRRR